MSGTDDTLVNSVAPIRSAQRAPVIELCGDSIGMREPVSGSAHLIRRDAEINKFREGEILVAAVFNPEWQSQCALAKAIVTESTQQLDLLRDVAMLHNLTIVVGVPQVMELLRSYDILQVSASGTIELLDERRAPSSPMRVAVPAARESRINAGDSADQSNPQLAVFPTGSASL